MKGRGRLMQVMGEIDYAMERKDRIRYHKKRAARKGCPKGMAFCRNYFAATTPSRAVM